MTSDLSSFAARLREFISICESELECFAPGAEPALREHHDAEFNGFALVLFARQFEHNSPYRKFCESRRVLPDTVSHWTQIPALPAAAFKEFEVSCLPPAERTRVFHSSGTTGQQPSRHFHHAESLALYETSLLAWFRAHLLHEPASEISNFDWLILTPPTAQALNSSLVHMLESIRRQLAAPEAAVVGRVAGDGQWTLDFERARAALHAAVESERPLIIPGTAFSFVHLLDFLAEKNLRFTLPPGSRVMETGGYKNRSRVLPKTELHALITQRLEIPPSHIVCEYGMSELSSQAYDRVAGDEWRGTSSGSVPVHPPPVTRHFRFPPWARARIVSPETGHEVADGQTGLVRVVDLANVFSVLALQTEDLAIRRGEAFELVGRAELAEPRGCSLLAAEIAAP